MDHTNESSTLVIVSSGTDRVTDTRSVLYKGRRMPKLADQK